MYIYWNTNQASIEVIVDGEHFKVYPDGETISTGKVDIVWHKCTLNHPMLHDRYVLIWIGE